VGGTKDDTGLTHLGAREYDPSLGRFVSIDPIMDMANPQQWNAYAYSHSDPINFSDPSGLIECGDDACLLTSRPSSDGKTATITDKRNPKNVGKTTISISKYCILTGPGLCPQVTVRINDYENTEIINWPRPGSPSNVIHGSWGVHSDETMSSAGTCELEATTSTGPIYASLRSN
jgi:RHS repeat-associated protein